MNRIITGKRGTGKSLIAIGIACEYLKRGSRVVTNLDMYPENFANKNNRDMKILRVPDVVEAEHLKNLPKGNPTLIHDPVSGSYKAGPEFEESKNGLILIDELLHSGNSRTWSQKGRQQLIEEINLLRKRGYDTIFIAQDKSMIDKQIMGSSADEIGYCRRLDRISVPVLSPLYKFFTGKRLTFPKVHICTFRAGESDTDMISERKTYVGKDYYQLYNSYQQFTSEYEHGPHSLLTPWHLVGRYQTKEQSILQKIAKIPFIIGFLLCQLVPKLKPHFAIR